MNETLGRVDGKCLKPLTPSATNVPAQAESSGARKERNDLVIVRRLSGPNSSALRLVEDGLAAA